MSAPRGGRRTSRSRLRVVPIAAALLLAAGPAATAQSRNVLWQIVSECLDPGRPAYCSRCAWPIESSCGAGRDCRNSTEVWVETPEYVAIRDVKMCGCPLGFVHGLALPRARVTGPEDPRRPDGIWTFAWNTARRRIPDEADIALVVNPPGRRTQDQLHVHLVRLAAGARARIAAGPVMVAAALDQAWETAARAAAAAGLTAYGVLVMRDDAGRGFLVLADAESPEDAFTIGACR